MQFCLCLAVDSPGGNLDTPRHCNTGCNTLQHWLQHAATHCNTLQHTATHCNTLQHTATHCTLLATLQHTTHCLQHTATHYNTLHTACNTLQHALPTLISRTLLEHGVPPQMRMLQCHVKCRSVHTHTHTYILSLSLSSDTHLDCLLECRCCSV